MSGIELTSRERIKRAIRRMETDRVPVDFGGTVVTCPEYNAHRNLKRYFGIQDGPDPIIDYTMGTVDACEELRLIFGSDVRRVGMNAIPPEIIDDGFVSGFGIRHRRARPHLYYDVVGHPLAEAEISDLENMTMPDPDAPELYFGLRERAKDLYENSEYAVVADFGVPGFYETAQKLRGYENFACDLIADKVFVTALFDRLLELQKKFFKNYIECVAPYAEVVCYADDLGMQDRLQVSPETYAEMILPYYKKIFGFMRSVADIRIMLHCCGAISQVLGELADAGVDIINPVQVRANGMDPGKLKREFGDKLAFWGGVDEQKLLPNGTPGEICAEVARLKDTLGHGGGFVLAPCHCIQPDVPAENVEAIYR